MKQYEVLKTEVKKFAAINNTEFSEESHFENGYGSNYITAKENTIGLTYADLRCGNRLAIVKHGENGTIDLISGYLTPFKLLEWIQTNIL